MGSCSQGHELTETNIYVHPSTGRGQCRTCRAEYRQRHDARRRSSATTPTEKRCYRCAETKPSSEFYKDRSRHDGLGSACKSCAKAVSADWAASNPERLSANRKRRGITKERAGWLARQYGLSPEEYDVLDARGNGCCWICRQPELGEKHLAVDHDHETGEVRGLLCTRCNRGLGSFRDDPTLITAALRYLNGGQ